MKQGCRTRTQSPASTAGSLSGTSEDGRSRRFTLCAPPPPAKNIRPGHIPTFIFTHFPTHTYHTGTVNAMLTPPPSCSTRPCPLPALGTIVASVVGSFATRYLPFAQSNQMHPLSLLVWPVGAGTARRCGHSPAGRRDRGSSRTAHRSTARKNLRRWRCRVFSVAGGNYFGGQECYMFVSFVSLVGR